MKGRPTSQQVQALAALYRRPPDRPNEEGHAGQGVTFRKAQTNGQELRGKYNGFHVTHASADPLLHRLEGVQKSGTGWRARCPACGGRSRKLSIVEASDRVLVHCFDCGDTEAVLAAVGLSWADLHPPRSWPPSRDERKAWSRAQREAGWSAALHTLALESKVVAIAARDICTVGWLGSDDDMNRLAQAVERISGAAGVLCSGAREVGA